MISPGQVHMLGHYSGERFSFTPALLLIRKTLIIATALLYGAVNTHLTAVDVRRR